MGLACQAQKEGLKPTGMSSGSGFRCSDEFSLGTRVIQCGDDLGDRSHDDL